MDCNSKRCCNGLRRTASLDAICLKGQWPKEAFYVHSGIFQISKATQTDSSSNKTFNCIEFNNEEDKFEKLIRQCLQKVNKDAQSSPKVGSRLISSSVDSSFCSEESQTLPVTFHKQIRSVPGSPNKGGSISISLKLSLTKPLMGSSAEGLNQEMEKLGLQDLDDRYCNCSIPDGRRAPVPDLLKQTRTVNTQTPGGNDEEEHYCETNHSSDQISFSSIAYSNNDVMT